MLLLNGPISLICSAVASVKEPYYEHSYSLASGRTRGRYWTKSKHHPRVYYVTMTHDFGDFVLKEKIAERLTNDKAIQAMNAINRAILALGLNG